MGQNIPERGIVAILSDLQRGDLIDDLDKALHKCTASVVDVRKKGSITITLEMAPTGKGTVAIAGNFKLKEPEHDRDVTTFFLSEDYDLMRDDPRQAKLPLTEIDEPDKEPAQTIEFPRAVEPTGE